jgi:hypothetical protein
MQFGRRPLNRACLSSKAWPISNPRRFSSHTTSAPLTRDFFFAFHLRPSPPLNKNQVCRGSPETDILRRMKVEEIAEAVAKLPPDQFARFRRWFTAFEAGRAFAELKKRAKEP